MWLFFVEKRFAECVGDVRQVKIVGKLASKRNDVWTKSGIFAQTSIYFGMITAKFGGTAITADNLKYVARCAEGRKFVVVSAPGKENDFDEKATDLLEKYYFCGDENVWQRFADKCARLAERNGVIMNVAELLERAKERARLFSAEYCLSLGEELAAKIVAEYLGATYCEAAEVFVFQNKAKALLNKRKTYCNLKRMAMCSNQVVLGGFYGGIDGINDRHVFGRGGGDVSGAVVAAATGSVSYENRTDVCGVMSADPRLVSKANTIRSLSYEQMRKLALAGAKVLHKDAVLPMEKCGAPIVVCSWAAPNGASTLVGNCPCRAKVLSVAERQKCGKSVCSVFHNMSHAEVSARLCRLFGGGLSSRSGVDKVVLDNNLLEIVSDRSILRPVFEAFCSDGEADSI